MIATCFHLKWSARYLPRDATLDIVAAAGVDSIKRNVAKIVQTSEANDDVKTPAEHEINEHSCAEIDQVMR